MKPIYKKILKIIGIAFVAFWVIVFILSGLYTYLEKRKEQKFIQELQRPYMEDTYGGSTPEETLELFLEALKEDNIELASKYFILDKQAEWKKYLEEVKKAGRTEEMISDLSRELKYKESLYENNKRYEIRDDQGNFIFETIDFIIYPNKVWKIIDL